MKRHRISSVEETSTFGLIELFARSELFHLPFGSHDLYHLHPLVRLQTTTGISHFYCISHYPGDFFKNPQNSLIRLSLKANRRECSVK